MTGLGVPAESTAVGDKPERRNSTRLAAIDPDRCYDVVTAHTATLLAVRVSEYIRRGWKCQGGPFVRTILPSPTRINDYAQGGSEWVQAMVREPPAHDPSAR